MERAIFGAGCFWGVQTAFDAMEGVVETVVGYSGGTTPNPTYHDVRAGVTGHAEVVRVTFDPTRVRYAMLVERFFALHDPTQLSRQGPDVGDQYRSVLFFTTLEQQKIAEEAKAKLQASGRYAKPIATALEPAPAFWPAEDYHQKYHAKQGGSCGV